MLIPSIDLQEGRVVQLVQGERLALAPAPVAWPELRYSRDIHLQDGLRATLKKTGLARYAQEQKLAVGSANSMRRWSAPSLTTRSSGFSYSSCSARGS